MVKIAEAGHTYQYLQFGYSGEVSEAVKRAIVERRGLRGLPRRTWQSPFHPHEIRKEWHDLSKVPPIYEQYYPISREELDLCSQEIQGIMNEDGAQYSVRLVRSFLSNEGLCYVKESSIPGAGMGLFLRPREMTISKGK